MDKNNHEFILYELDKIIINLTAPREVKYHLMNVFHTAYDYPDISKYQIYVDISVWLKKLRENHDIFLDYVVDLWYVLRSNKWHLTND